MAERSDDRREYMCAYYQAHKIEQRERSRRANAKWRAKPENKAKRSEYMKAYYQAHKEYFRDKAKEAHIRRKIERYYAWKYSGEEL